ncbi:MAG: SLBB domain-containing protein, partial [Deferrisomatales bacterium]
LDLDAALAGDPAANLLLAPDDQLVIRAAPLVPEEDFQVKVGGEVRRPGEYRLHQGMRVTDLVREAGGVKPLTAYLPSAEITRIEKTGDARRAAIVTIDLGAALAGDPAHDLELAPEDSLVVHQAPLVPELTHTVRVSGEVRRPGEYRLRQGMRVRDLLGEAGDPHPVRAFLQNAELNRIRIEAGTVTSFPITVNLAEALARNPEHNLLLEPYDELIVRRLPNWVDETERYVTLGGEVQFPGVYPIYRGERLSSVITRAGGFTDRAYLRGAKFTRKRVQEEQQRRLAEVVQRTEADIAKKQADLASVASSEEELRATQTALEGLTRSLEQLKQAQAEGRIVLRLAPLPQFQGGPYDVELLGGDALAIPQASNAVSVLGQVFNPTTVIAVPGKTVAYYLGQAGGPNRDADESAIYVIRADGSVVSRQQRYVGDGGENWFTSGWGRQRFLDLELASGDTVVVPQELEKIAWMREIKDYTQILANVALSAGVLLAAGL